MAVNIDGQLTNNGGQMWIGPTFNPLSLFAASEQGAWYDVSDTSTMFQDSAGTTPVTAVEQAVGRILDKSGRGNHATQSSDASRPILRARYNLLTYSEQFDNAAWLKQRSTAVNVSSPLDPLGGTTADQVTANSTHPTSAGGVSQTATVPAGTTVFFSAYLKAGNATWAMLSVDDNAAVNVGRIWFDVVNGTVGTTGALGTGFVASNGTITPAGNGWFRCSATFTTSGVTTIRALAYCAQNGNGSTASTLNNFAYIWGAQFVPTAVFPNNTYQRIAAATDYATGPQFPQYLAFDGADDSLLTSSVNFSATDKMTVWAGVTKQSDAAQGVVAELSATIASNNGAFLLTAPNSAAANYNFSSKGTTQVDNTVTSFAAPTSSVVTGQCDIAAPSNIIRVNGAQAGQVFTTQGTGNFGNYPLYIGRRNNATLPFNGRLYQLVIRGAASTADQINAMETYIDNIVGAY